MRNYRARAIKDGKPVFDEDHEHITVAHWLTLQHRFFIHVPNEGKRSWQTGKKLKRMGMLKGVVDFLIFEPSPLQGKPTALELKALDGKVPPPEQIAFMAGLELCGWQIGWHRGADAAIQWLESLGYGL